MFIVETKTGNVWENYWYVGDRPTTFITHEQAEDMLNKYFTDSIEAVRNGDRFQVPERDNFRVTELTKTPRGFPLKFKGVKIS